jgi:hypothetical protein
MKRLSWQLIWGFILVALSILLYLGHYVIFEDSHHIFIYLLGDIAFLPIEVLLVTLIVHRLLTIREKRILLKKLNMVIGAFFSEIGTELLKTFADSDARAEVLTRELVMDQDWSRKEFLRIKSRVMSHDYSLEIKGKKLIALRNFLVEKRDFMVRLLENPNLLEHELFTDLLWAVFHLTEELAYRKNLSHLPKTDLEHLAGDMKRVYSSLVIAWLDYMEHLHASYPYLFSLAMRTNPFDRSASPIVE